MLTYTNLSEVERALRAALVESDSPCVVGLKGRWGEGKTYFWKQFVGREPKLKESRYISVFGADSIQEIREAVVAAAIGDHEGRGTRTGRLISTALKALTNIIAGTAHVSPSLVVQLLEAESIKDKGMILCVDDIERVGKHLSMEVLLGYLAKLRDEYKARVLLIFNEDELIRNEEFATYHDKVIDREVPFHLDASDLVPLALSTGATFSSDQISDIVAKCRVLELSNIRTLMRFRRYYEDVRHALGVDVRPSLLGSVISSILLFTWMRFTKDCPVKFEQLGDFSQLASTLRRADSKNAEIAPEEEVLRRYGYSHTDDLDRVLMNFVKSDLLDSAKLGEELRAIESGWSRAARSEEFNEVWQTHYHGTLRNNTIEFTDLLARATRAYLDGIPLGNLDEALSMLRRLGADRAAQMIFDEFVTSRGKTVSIQELEQPFEPLGYEPLRAFVRATELERNIDDRSIGEVIDSIVNQEFVPSTDEKRFDQFGVDELVRYYLDSPDRKRKTSELRELRKRLQNERRQKVVEAAQQIAKTNRINRQRMISMGLASEIVAENGKDL